MIEVPDKVALLAHLREKLIEKNFVTLSLLSEFLVARLTGGKVLQGRSRKAAYRRAIADLQEWAGGLPGFKVVHTVAGGCPCLAIMKEVADDPRDFNRDGDS